MSERFEDRIDTNLLSIENAKVLSRKSEGFDPDSDVSLLWKCNASQKEEVIKHLKENNLVYDGIVCDFQRIDGTFRTVGLEYAERAGGVVQSLKEGYYTTLDWNAARIASDRIRPSGTNADLAGGDEQERYIVFEFRYISQDYENALVNSMPETKSDIAEVPEGTWYLIDATSVKQEDGTFTIQALYSNTSMFAISGRESYNVPTGAKLYNYSNVPKQLAQGLCDLYSATGDTVIPSFNNGSGLVDIRVEVHDYAAITLSGIETENSCRYDITTTYYYGVDELPALPAKSTGIVYSRGGVYLDRAGKYNCYIERKERLPQNLLGEVSEISARQTVTQNQKLGAKSLSPLSVEEGHVKSRSVRVNEDCTYDETVNDAEINDQEGSGASESADKSTLIETHTSVDELSTMLSPDQGVIIDVSSEPTEDGRFRTREATTTSISRQTEDDETAAISKTRETVRNKGRNLRDEDLSEYNLSSSATQGVVETREQSDNEDGTFNVTKNVSTSVPTTFEDGTIEQITSNRTTTRKNGKNILDAGLSAFATDVAATIGKTQNRTQNLNEDGSFDVVLDSTVSTPHKSYSAKVVEIQQHATTTETLLKNQLAAPADPIASEGQTIQVTYGENEDGSLNVRTDTRAVTEQVSTDAETVVKDFAIEVVQAKSENIPSADIDGFAIPVLSQGQSARLSKTKNTNGTFNASLEVETESDLTATDATTSDRRSESAEEIIDEERHTAATAAIPDSTSIFSEGIIVDTVSTPKRNGLYETIIRKITSVVSSVSSYTSRVDKGVSVSSEETKNVRSALLGDYDISWTECDIGKSFSQRRIKNPDGTYNIESSVETESDLTATGATTSDFHRETYLETVDDEAHTGAVVALNDTAVAEGVITETRSRKKGNGLFETTKRIVTSAARTVSSYASGLSSAYTRYRTTGKNIRAASLPSVINETGHVKTYTKVLNPDQTYDYELVDEAVIPQESTEWEKSAGRTVTRVKHLEGSELSEPSSPSAGTIVKATQTPTESGKFDTTLETTVVSSQTDFGTYYTRNGEVGWWRGRNATSAEYASAVTASGIDVKATGTESNNVHSKVVNDAGRIDYEIIVYPVAESSSAIDRDYIEIGWLRIEDTPMTIASLGYTFTHVYVQTWITNSSTNAQAFCNGGTGFKAAPTASGTPANMYASPIGYLAGYRTHIEHSISGGWKRATRVYGGYGT